MGLNQWLVIVVLAVAGCTHIDIDGDGNKVETSQVFDRESTVDVKAKKVTP